MKLMTLGILLASPVMAQSVPPADFFAGRFEVIGRAASIDFVPLSDRVTIATTGGDFPLLLDGCRLGKGHLQKVDDPMEGGPLLSGTLGALPIWCYSQTDGDNYPILSCYIEPEGDDTFGLLTMWPSNGSTLPSNLQDCE